MKIKMEKDEEELESDTQRSKALPKNKTEVLKFPCTVTDYY
jgi:hypothetical protein